MTHREAALHRFLPSANKVSYVSAHPVQPWIALVDKNSGAQIWNWKTGEILYTAQFGGIDESALHYHSLQKMAEVDPAYWGAKVSQEQSVSKTPSGRLKMIEFMDVETLYWNRVSDLSIMKGRAGEIVTGNVPGAIAVQKERWVIFVCENKILFHELISHKSHELSKIALDSKNPTCISIVTDTSQSGALDDTLIAIGCNDGTIRLVSFSTFKTVVKLGYRSASVTCLRTVHTSATGTLLISGSLEGNLYSWDPFPNVAASGGSLPPQTTLNKAHDGEILALALGYSSPYATAPGIFALGGDRSVAVYDLPGLKCLTKFRCPNQKTVFHSMAICSPLEASPDMCPVLIGAQNMIHGTTISGGNYFKIFEPSASMPPALKKPPKIYHFTLHPLQRHWLILAMNAGVMLVKLAVPFMGMTVSLPIPKTPKQALELTCLRVRKQSLLQTEFMVVQQDSSNDGVVRYVPETIMDREVMEVSDAFGSGGRYQLALAPDTSRVALIRTDANRFVILSNDSQLSWADSFDGDGSALVWNATSDCVATLSVPPPTKSIAPQRSLGRLISRTDSAQSATQDVPPPIVKIYKLDSRDPRELPCGDCTALTIHGGPLLGVTYGNRGGGVGNVFMFYSWETSLECSDELEAPEWLAWSSSFDLCAFAYPTHLLLFLVSERFHPLTSVPVQDATSGLWKGDLLYVTTHTSIECIVVQRSKQTHDFNAILSIQVIVLASFKDVPNWLTGEVENPKRTQKARPIGHLKILNASREKVWVVDSHEVAAIVDITYPGFLALAHTIDEEYSAAREAAMGKLSSDCLGQMFLTTGKKAAVEALKLPGLSLQLRLRSAIEARYLKHALLCLQAIASGCRRPEAVVRLPEFRETLKEKLPTPKATLGGELAGQSPFSGDEIPDSAPTSLTSALTGDSIDWDLPLKLYTEKKPNKSTVEVSREILQLGLSLHDAAVDDRMYDVADSAVALVVKHCNESRDGDLLVQLETRLSSREQTTKLKDLMILSEQSRKSRHGQLRGLTAAALSGDRLALSELLQDLKLS